MITAIYSFKETNATLHSVKQIKDNPTYNIMNASSPAKSNQISFKGNLAKVGGNVLEDVGSKFGGKVRRFAGEAAESARGIFKKLLKGKEELPFAEKPLIKPVKTKEEIAKEIAEYNRKHPSDVKVEGPKSDSPSDKGWAEHWKNEAEKKHSNKKKYYDDSDNSNDLNNHDKTSFKGNEKGVEKSDIDTGDTDLKDTDTDLSFDKDLDLDTDLDKDLDLDLDHDLDLDLDRDMDLDLDIDVDPDIDIDPTDLF